VSDAKVEFKDEDTPGKPEFFTFKCPKADRTCGWLMIRGASGDRPSWEWDGNRERPTFTPSVDCKGCWHGYIRAGRCVDPAGQDEP
jgi:hypothetical protein